MAVGRKGIVFTLMAIVVIAFIFASSSVVEKPETRAEIETESARTRVAMMNSYLDTLEAHAAASLATAGYFTLKNMSKKVTNDGFFLTMAEVNHTVDNCITNNTIRVLGVDHDCLNGSQRVQVSLNQLRSLGQTNLGLNTEFEIHRAWVVDTEPYEVTFYMNISYNITDPIFAKWQRQHIVIGAPVYVEGIADPTFQYLVANGYLTQPRNFSESEVRRFQFNPAVFPLHYGNASYISVEGLGPSVLNKYAGWNLEQSSCCGIESVVTESEIGFLPGSARNYSLVDHQFTSQLQGTRGLMNCENLTLRAFDDRSGDTVVMHWDSFINIYNLTDAQAACP